MERERRTCRTSRGGGRKDEGWMILQSLFLLVVCYRARVGPVCLLGIDIEGRGITCVCKLLVGMGGVGDS